MSTMLILWIGILLITLVIEVATMGLTTIWFAGGAFAAMIIELLNGNIFLQVTAFLIISLILLFFTRPVAVKYFNKERTKTNLDSLIGKQAVVITPIHNLKETGRVIIDGMEWMARSKDASKTYDKDAIVRIVEIKGVKLIVESEETA